MRFYTGIGAGTTPGAMLTVMTELANTVRHCGWTLRSGHSPGADQAFELGANGDAHIFLPWPTYQHKLQILGTVFSSPTSAALALAAQHHPNWGACDEWGKLLQARNSHQVLGYELDAPSDFVVCWTPNGSITGGEPDTGGTGQALRVATAYDIPIFNLQRHDDRKRLARWIG